VSNLARFGATALDPAVVAVLILVDPDPDEAGIVHRGGDRRGLIAPELDQRVPAPTEPRRRSADDAILDQRPVDPAVENRARFEGDHVPGKEAQLIGRDVRSHRRQNVHPAPQLPRERGVEVAEQRVDAVATRAGDRDGIDVGGHDVGGRLGGAEHGRHRPAPRAEVDGRTLGRQERGGTARKRLRERPRHVDTWVDGDPQPAERDEARDPGERLAAETPLDEPFEVRGPVPGRDLDQRVGLRFGRDEPTLGERADEPPTCLLRYAAFVSQTRSAMQSSSQVRTIGTSTR
jgi:hypothetical protein